MTPRLPPPRLHVFLAREAPVGVVLRRGPSAWAQLTLWDRDADTFEPGQWTRARVYGRRADLSADGRLFVYFAARHGRLDDPRSGPWTAISRPPWFTALVSWPNLGTWYGGGVFERADRVLLDVSCSLEPDPGAEPPPLEIGACPADSAPWEQRLLLGGWTLVERGFHPRTHRRVGAREIWSRPRPGGGPTLFREVEEPDFRRRGGPFADTYWLETGDDLVLLPRVTWADWDGDRARLLVVRDGLLLETSDPGTSPGVSEARSLFDFDPLVPERVAAPDWARSWPSR